MSDVHTINVGHIAKRRSALRYRAPSSYDSRLHMVTQLVMDIVALTLSWYVAIQLRLFLNPYMRIHLSREQLVHLSPSLGAVLMLWVVASLWLYRFQQSQDSATSLAGKAVESAVAIGTTIVVCTFFSAEFNGPLSRSVVLLLAAVSLISLGIARLPERMLMSIAAERLLPVKRMAILGAAAEARLLMERIETEEAPHYRVTGIILPRGSGQSSNGALRVLGTSDQVAEIINREQLDRIILVTPGVGPDEANECGNVSRRMGVTVSYALGSAATNGIKVRLTMRYGMQLLEQQPVSFTRQQELIKRVFDVMGAALGFLILLPLLSLFAILVKFTSDGPALYRSRRVGKGGRHFLFLKFRSMRQIAASRESIQALNESSGHLFKIKDDPRVTSVGRFMRRYSIDEAPQLLNVLRGEMSLVGPRPLPAGDLDPDGMSKEFSLWAEQRARVLPGITGLWQVRGRSDLTFEEMMKLDAHYIRNWSLLLDLKILLATPLAVFTGRGAY